jgi:hypothetical protein
MTSGDTCSVAALCLDYDHDSTDWTLGLMLVSGICWTSVYMLYIHACLQHQRYVGIPPAALFLNIAWEAVFSLVWLENMGTPQLIVNRIWLVFDMILLTQFIRYEFRKAGVWYSLQAMTLWGLLGCIVTELKDYNGVYMAFGQNLVMSMLFCQQLLSPDADVGVLPIDDTKVTWVSGMFRLVGTAAASTVFYMRTSPSTLLSYLYLSIGMWDMVYVGTSLWYCFVKEKQHRDGREITSVIEEEEVTATTPLIGNDEAPSNAETST